MEAVDADDWEKRSMSTEDKSDPEAEEIVEGDEM
jgi:hypothetical protein